MVALVFHVYCFFPVSKILPFYILGLFFQCLVVHFRFVTFRDHIKSRQQKHKMAEAYNLPEEVWFHTIAYLEHVRDVLNLGCTCRRLYEVTNQNVIWKRRFNGSNDHLLRLHQTSHFDHVTSNDESENFDVEPGFWKKLYLRASHALSFQNRRRNGFFSVAGERLCAEFVANPSAARSLNGVRFDDRAPKKQSVELWVKLNKKKPDGIIIGCQSESVRYLRQFVCAKLQKTLLLNN